MNVAVLGIGLLGRPVAERLHACGHTVVVYNRTRAKLEPLREAGLLVADSASAAVRQADAVLLLLTDAAAIRSVLFAEDVRTALRGRTVIQMGTIAPEESRALHDAVRQMEADYFECPVLGSIAEAQGGRLFLMAGAEPDQFSRWRALLASLGPDPRHVGRVGQAAALKLALNQLIAVETTAFSLSLHLIQRAGVSVEIFMDILRGSAVYAPTFDKKLPRLLGHDYANPNFSSRHLLKDVDLCLAEVARSNLNTSVLAAVRAVVEDAVHMGLGDVDYSALAEALDRASRTTSSLHDAGREHTR